MFNQQPNTVQQGIYVSKMRTPPLHVGKCFCLAFLQITSTKGLPILRQTHDPGLRFFHWPPACGNPRAREPPATIRPRLPGPTGRISCWKHRAFRRSFLQSECKGPNNCRHTHTHALFSYDDDLIWCQNIPQPHSNDWRTLQITL